MNTYNSAALSAQPASQTQRGANLRLARRIGRRLGYAGGAIAIAQVFASGSAARENQNNMQSIQRSLLPQLTANPTAPFQQLIGPYLALGLLGLLAFLSVLWLCGCAGRLAVTATGERRTAGVAARQTALIASLLWIAASLLTVGVFHADLSFSWLLATFFSSTLTDSLVNMPGSHFELIQLTILLLAELLALGATILWGWLAGSIGGSSAPNSNNPPFTAPQPYPTSISPYAPYGYPNGAYGQSGYGAYPPPQAAPLYQPPTSTQPTGSDTSTQPQQYPPQYPPIYNRPSEPSAQPYP